LTSFTVSSLNSFENLRLVRLMVVTSKAIIASYQVSTNPGQDHVTLEKSEADYSPTTRYADYPISPTLFHWESQNSTSLDTPTGRRYVGQPTRGTNVVLFVRERKKDGRGETLPYHCLGRARYIRHEAERPMRILWELERPMPGWLYQAGKVVAG